MSNQPLNPFLYERLQRQFGEVLIANDGTAMDGHLVDLGDGRPRFNLVWPGEYYRVCCCFCGDQRNRLWINHRWGVGPEGVPGERLWWMAICYNENCLERVDYRHALRTMLYGTGRECHPSEIRILRGTVPDCSLGIVDWPGICLRVDQLQPDHHARQYLLSRGIDPECVGKTYNVSYCQSANADNPMAHGRLVIPIMMRGTMVGWQARYVGDPDWKTVNMPKYYNSPGVNKRAMLYGFDQASPSTFCVVVEGVSDAWAVGAGAVALLGKTMSQQQFDLVRSQWRSAVVMLDNDAQQAADKVCQRLREAMPVVQVTLPAGTDPAGIGSQDALWDLIYAAAVSQGVDLLAEADQRRVMSN